MFNTRHTPFDPFMSAQLKLLKLMTDPPSYKKEMLDLAERLSALEEAEASLNLGTDAKSAMLAAESLHKKAEDEYKKSVEDSDAARKLSDEMISEAKAQAKLSIDNAKTVADQMQSEAEKTLKDANEKHDSVTSLLEKMADEHSGKMAALSEWEDGLKQKDAELSNWEETLTELQKAIDEKVEWMTKLGVKV